MCRRGCKSARCSGLPVGVMASHGKSGGGWVACDACQRWWVGGGGGPPLVCLLLRLCSIYCQYVTLIHLNPKLTTNSHRFPYQEVFVGAAVSCHVFRALDCPACFEITLPSPLLRDISDTHGSASDSSVSSCSQASHGMLAPPAQDWTQIINRARTDHLPAQWDTPVNKYGTLLRRWGMRCHDPDRQP